MNGKDPKLEKKASSNYQQSTGVSSGQPNVCLFSNDKKNVSFFIIPKIIKF